MKKPLFGMVIMMVIWILFLPSAFPARAEVRLPRILGDNMVLQQNRPLPVWGSAAPGEEVTVTFGGQSRKDTADGSGRWEVILAPLTACFAPAVMTISGTNTLRLNNILVGEVWLCSGQSNMAYSMSKSSKYAHAARSTGLSGDALKNIDQPAIRLFLVKRSLYEENDRNRGWEAAAYESVRDFSAAGYFFALKIHETLKVPVGIISAAVPGSPIERWAPEEVFARQPGFRPEIPSPASGIDEMGAGKFYYGRIQPLAPFALAGFLWYQGETNCFKNEAFDYTDKMQALINTWRYIWKNKALPFYYVQIAPFYYSRSKGEYPLTGDTLPRFWEAQAAALEIPHTGMVVTTDLVDDLEGIHPSYKWEVGRRLALWALAETYGKKGVVCSGPMFKSMKIKKDKMMIEFSYGGDGLVSRDSQPLSWFEIAGAGGVFVQAHAVIRGKKVVVSSPGISHPVAVRFAWDEAAQPHLVNREGLPAVPFRSNGPEWKGKDKSNPYKQ